MREDPLGFAVRIADEYGDYAFVRIGWVRIYFVNRPELVREVLVTKAKSFHKLSRQMNALRKVEGEGLVVAENPTWARHRPIVQGSFHHRHFGNYGDTLVACTRRRIENWPQNQSFDLAAETNELALEIMARVVFGVDLAAQAPELRGAVHEFRVQMMREVSSAIPLPDWLPLPSKRRQKEAIEKIDSLVWRLIRERKAAPGEEDMLSQILFQAKNRPELGITDREVRDEAATLFLAGHDATSAATAWFWYCLARYPGIQDKVLEEVDALGGRPAGYGDLRQLKFLEMVVRESMRLYSTSGFLYSREAIEDVELGGYTLKKGAWIFISPFIVQRNPIYFPQPESFCPARFDAGAEQTPYTNLVFGAGPRVCIGNTLAVMEIMLIATTVLQRFRLVLDQGEPEPELEIFLRPKGGLRMIAVPREAARAAAPTAAGAAH